MTNKFFSLDEEFNTMIQKALPEEHVNSIYPISTGWTNIVYEAETNNGNYFFRFPRDEFWIRTIVKDCEFAQYIQGKTKTKTVDLKLDEDKDRPFSIHKKIDGVALTERINTLSDNELAQVAKEISEFMYELHTLDFKKSDVFKNQNIGHNLVDFLNELINLHVKDEDKTFWKYKEFSKKDTSCLVHGDLNLGNVLLDDENHVAAIIDFGFAGFGNKYDDIARILSRDCPKAFKDGIINTYEELSKEKIDQDKLNTEIKLWKDIDSGYIKYMRSIGIYE